MSSAYGAIPRPRPPPSGPGTSSSWPPLAAVLGTINQAYAPANLALLSVPPMLPLSSPLFSHLQSLLNHEIRAGNTYPQEQPLDAPAFQTYFLSADAFLALRLPPHDQYPPNLLVDPSVWTQAFCQAHVAGTFYIKPNFPGRCSHVCNGGFIVSPAHRGRKVGVAMALAFVRLAPTLGYRASMFNLVFVSNVVSVRLWTRCGFKVIGRIPGVGRLKKVDATGQEMEEEDFVDALMFFFDFEKDPVPPLSLLWDGGNSKGNAGIAIASKL